MVEFRPIKSLPGYSISNTGFVMNDKTGTIRRTPIRNGYKTVCIRKDGGRKNYDVHRLVALAFCKRYRPFFKFDYVNHIDGDKWNNCAENLEWCSQSHNIIHYYRLRRSHRELLSC